MTEWQLREAQSFLQKIADRPGDQLQRLIFADWLMEQGLDKEAAGQCWAAKHNKRPLRNGWYYYYDKDANLPDTLCFNGRNRLLVLRHTNTTLEAEQLLLQRFSEVEWDELGEPYLTKENL